MRAMSVRYAIVGSGMMGQEHIRNLALLPGTGVSAVCDPDPGMRESARALAGPGCRAFADHRELLDAGIADAFVVASPNHTHRAVLDDLLEAGQPVLVEKPLCTTLEDCQAVLARAARGAAPVWVAMEYRYMPAVARLLERVRAGDIGALRMVSIREHRFPFLAKVGDWNRFNRFTGGTLVEKCCHFFDLMRLMVRAEPTRVFASGSQDVNHLEESYAGERPDILDNAIVTVEFAGGVRAVLELCMFAEGSYFQEQIAAIGDQASPTARTRQPTSRWRRARRAAGPSSTSRSTRRCSRQAITRARPTISTSAFSRSCAAPPCPRCRSWTGCARSRWASQRSARSPPARRWRSTGRRRTG
jgi:predicted dehydrogenase